MIIVESKRKKPSTILKKYPDTILADVTSRDRDGFVKLIRSILTMGFLYLSARVISYLRGNDLVVLMAL